MTAPFQKPKAERTVSANEVIRPNGLCNRQGCDKPSTVWLVETLNNHGEIRAFAPGSVMDGWVMRQGHTFAGWLERCGYCFSVERLREETSRWRKDGLQHPVNWGLEKFQRIRSLDAFIAAFPEYAAIARKRQEV